MRFLKKRQITFFVLMIALVSIIFIPMLAGLASATEQKKGVVNENAPNGLNVRTGAGTTYDKLTYNGVNVKIGMGTEVIILDEVTVNNVNNPRWYEIEFTYENTK